MAPEVTLDGEQIVVVGTLPDVNLAAGASDETKAAAGRGRISRFREATRRERIWIAREAEELFKKNVTWGAACGGARTTFTPGGSGRQGSDKATGGPSVKIGRRIY
ncbi:MAG TPA: hypothetical protein VNG93_05530 [Candidatus Dormibacteraeota bacterium]|nr:hypothetical protein [Candidatus Dormibacteraeota bacterium]